MRLCGVKQSLRCKIRSGCFHMHRKAPHRRNGSEEHLFSLASPWTKLWNIYNDFSVIQKCYLHGSLPPDVNGFNLNNNQNNVMQFLTVVTFIFSIPTIVSGFFGMNVINLPFENDPYGFWIILLITTVICLILTVLLSKNKLL